MRGGDVGSAGDEHEYEYECEVSHHE